MKKSRFSEEQIIGFLKEAEARMKTTEIFRREGFHHVTFYNWRAQFGGMEASEVQRLRALERENAELKKLLAKAHLDIAELNIYL